MNKRAGNEFTSTKKFPGGGGGKPITPGRRQKFYPKKCSKVGAAVQEVKKKKKSPLPKIENCRNSTRGGGGNGKQIPRP